MRIAIWFIAAAAGYLAGSLNLAIVLSKAIYHEDIRTVGSKNPGFTNFKRVYGNRYAWFIFAFDLLKGAVMSLIFGLLFQSVGLDRQLGAAFTGACVMAGHMYPFQYHWKGGKGFLVLLSVIWVIDWRAGLIATAVMVVLLLTLKYMSLATMCGLAAGSVSLFLFGTNTWAAVIYSVCTVYMIWRHRENIRRLAAGTESKFTFGKKEK